MQYEQKRVMWNRLAHLICNANIFTNGWSLDDGGRYCVSRPPNGWFDTSRHTLSWRDGPQPGVQQPLSKGRQTITIQAVQVCLPNSPQLLQPKKRPRLKAGAESSHSLLPCDCPSPPLCTDIEPVSGGARHGRGSSPRTRYGGYSKQADQRVHWIFSSLHLLASY